jgi:hypothetical protein
MRYQRTEKWYEVKKGKFSGSDIWKLLSKPRSKKAQEAGELAGTTKTYIIEKVAQFLGVSKPQIHSKYLDHGTRYEDDAMTWYYQLTGDRIYEAIHFWDGIPVGFIPYEPFPDFAGASPDGYVYHDKIVQIKCPNPDQHLKYMLMGLDEFKKVNDYYAQVQFEMMVSNRSMCDFVTFHPDFDSPDLQGKILEVPADPEFQEEIHRAIEKSAKYFTQYVKAVITEMQKTRKRREELRTPRGSSKTLPNR